MITSPGQVILAAPAKINLYLEILGRRSDGFHELETVFQTLVLADQVTVRVSDGSAGVRLWCSDPSLPQDHDNLAYRAAVLVAAAVPGLGRIEIELEKRIPHGAGLGGGSSDAAAVLRALARLDARVRGLDLPALALALGSDVPFFLLGGTAHATGRGERLAALPDAQGGPLTVLMPPERLATPRVFAALSDAERGPRAARGPTPWASPLAWLSLLHNRLTSPAQRLCPAVGVQLGRLAAQGVPHLLSGSGAACIAFARTDPAPGTSAFPTTFRARGNLDALIAL